MLKLCPRSQRTWPSPVRTWPAHTGQRRKAATTSSAWRCSAGIGHSAGLLEHAAVDGEQRGLLVLGEALVARDRLLGLRHLRLPGGALGVRAGGQRIDHARLGE